MNASFFQKYPFHFLSAVLLTFLPLLCSSWVTYWVLAHEADLRQFGIADWLLVTIICLLTSVFALTPPTFLAIVFGYFLGWGSLIPLLILNLGAIALVNRITLYLDKQRLLSYLAQNQKVKLVVGRFNQDQWPLIFFTKLSPVLPFALTNLVFSLAGASLKNMLLGGFLGMIPRTLLAVYVGIQAKAIRQALENPNPDIWSQVVVIGLVILSVVGISWVGRRFLKE